MPTGDLPSLTKNDATTTRKPASGPTERSMPPVSSAMFCPMARNPIAVAAVRIVVRLNAERNAPFWIAMNAPSSTMTAATSALGA